MTSLDARPKLLLLFVFALYFLQGWVAGFSGTALLNDFGARGVSAASIGMYSFIIGLPWLIKIIWSPIIDRMHASIMGKRRGWIVVSLLGANLTLFALAFLPRELMTIAFVFMIASLFLSITDTAVDGLIIDKISTSESGLVSALSNSGSVIGGCVSGLVFSQTLLSLGYHQSVYILCAFTMILSLLPFLVLEKNSDRIFALSITPSTQSASFNGTRFAKLLVGRSLKASSLSVLVLSFIVFFSLSVVSLTFNLTLLQKLHWTSVQLSRFQSILGLVSGSLGAFVIGWACDRFGSTRIWTILMTVTSGFFLALAIAPDAFITFSLIFLTVIPGLIFVAMTPSVIAISRGAVAATSFSVCMTLMNFGGISGTAISDWFFKLFSSEVIYCAQALVFTIGAVTVYIRDRAPAAKPLSKATLTISLADSTIAQPS